MTSTSTPRWFTLLVQLLIVKNIRSRMAHILRLHGADEDDEIVGLLEELNTNAVKAEEHNYEERNEDGENKEDDETHVHVDVVGDEHEDDHIMYFKRSNRDCPGPLRAFKHLSAFLSKYVLYGVFVWARRALNS